MVQRVVKILTDDSRDEYYFDCPGCRFTHSFRVPPWTFNNNFERPTVRGSILVKWVSCPDNPEKDEAGNHILGGDGRLKGAKDMICHSFVTDGRIQFLGDCTHELAGQTVELEDIND